MNKRLFVGELLRDYCLSGVWSEQLDSISDLLTAQLQNTDDIGVKRQ
jgi:hypothetical protein